jgi:hypothetical protein
MADPNRADLWVNAEDHLFHSSATGGTNGFDRSHVGGLDILGK